MISAFSGNVKNVVTNKMKSILTSPSNLKRLIFFDKNGAETQLQDTSGNNGIVTLSAAANTLSPSTVGKFRTLNFSSNAWWSLLSAADLNFGNGTTDSAFSIASKIKLDNLTNNVIFYKYDVANGKEYACYVAANKINFAILDYSKDVYIGRKYSSDITGDYGNWHTYICTYSGGSSAANMNIYRDGTKIDDESIGSAQYVAMEVGTANIGNYYILTGTTKTGFGSYAISCMAITSECLTQGQVTSVNNLLNT